MSGISINGDSREAAILQIVASLAFSEGKSGNNGHLVFTRETSRDWIRDAFAFARECLDGPATK